MEGIYQALSYGTMHGQTEGSSKKKAFGRFIMVGLSLFWEDAWEQLPTMEGKEGLYQINKTMIELGWTHVHHYWKERGASYEGYE
jgi:hypothetical protein